MLKLLEFLQLRWDCAPHAGRDCTIDMNQSILLGNLVIAGQVRLLIPR